MEKETKHGGAREGSGAPKKDDPKVPVRSGVRKSVVNRVGGLEEAQKLVPELLEKHADEMAKQ